MISAYKMEVEEGGTGIYAAGAAPDDYGTPVFDPMPDIIPWRKWSRLAGDRN